MPGMSSFFRRYADAYLAFDAHAVIPFYNFPYMIIDNHGDHMIPEETDLLSYICPFLRRLEENDLRTIDPDVSAEWSLEPGSSVCSVRYHFQNRSQKTLGDFEAYYVLVRPPDGWRIKFAKVGQTHSWNM